MKKELQTELKITYAQQKIRELIKERKLRKWCIENGIECFHSFLYAVATGIREPSYVLINSLSVLIPPAEWFFYTDEQIKWESKPIPKFDCENKVCKFLAKGDRTYMEISGKYGLSPFSLKRIVTKKSSPTFDLMQKLRFDVNPEDFFTGDEGEAYAWLPKQYEAVTYGKFREKYIVLSSERFQKETKTCVIGRTLENRVEVKTVSFLEPSIKTCGKTDRAAAEKILESLKGIME